MNKSLNSDEIDIKVILFSLIRHKALIILFTLGGFFTSLLINSLLSQKYKGEFQIVIENKTNSALSNLDPSNIGRVIRSRGKNTNLETQFEILKSPSLLINIFEFVKDKKTLEKDYLYRTLDFKRWKEKFLTIESLEDTSVLNVSFIDKDKELILPVLKKISNKYQEYSTQKRKSDLDNGINFFEKQIPIIKQTSKKSMEKLQKFSLTNNLNIGNLSENSFSLEPLAIEVQRVGANNEMNILDENIKIFNKIDASSDELIAYVKNIPDFTNKQLLKEISKLNNLIAKESNIYKSDDIYIKELKKNKITLLNKIKEETELFFRSKRKLIEAKVKASTLPESVVLTYFELLSEAKQDQSILNNFQTSIVKLKLEKGKVEDPWDLITNPTVIPGPIYPRKKRNIYTGIILGALLSALSSVIFDKLKGVTYTRNEIEFYGELPIVGELKLKDKENLNSEFLELFFKKFFEKNEEDTSFLLVGDVNDQEINNFEYLLNKYNENGNLFIHKSVKESYKFEKVFLISFLGITNIYELLNIKKLLTLQGKTPLGILIINNLFSLQSLLNKIGRR